MLKKIIQKFVNLPLWIKSSFGPVMILILFTTSVLFSIRQIESIAQKTNFLNRADLLAEYIYKAQDYQASYLLTHQENNVKEFISNIEHGTKTIELMMDEVTDTDLHKDINHLAPIVQQYQEAFNQVIANYQSFEALSDSTTQSYELITSILKEKIKTPLEEKKNNALITGEGFSTYDQEFLSLTERFLTQMLECRLAENNYFLLQKQEESEAFSKNRETINQIFEEWSFIITTMDNEEYAKHQTQLKTILQNYSQENFEKRASLQLKNNQIIEKTLALKKEGLESIRSFKQQAALLVETTKNEVYQSMLFFLAMGLILGLGISIGSGLAISRPVQNIALMLKDIAQGEGDLTKRLNINRKDEIGEQAKWFDMFVEKITDIVRALTSISTQLSGSSIKISDLAGHLVSSAESSFQNSHTVSVATEQLSSNINNIAAGTEQTSSNMKMISSATNQMNEAINEIASSTTKSQKITNQAVEQASFVSEKVSRLGSSAREISTITDTINDISQKTNLLALNATIEAARAGVAGKGFAVVAQEIKELSNQTAAATEDIVKTIDGIQGTTSDTIAEIEKITSTINEVNEIVTNIAAALEQQNSTTKEINANVHQATQGVEEISQNINQSSTAATSIATDISKVSQSVESMNECSSEVDSNSQNLLQLAGQLDEVVGRFKI